jgi:hypothetical protein
MKEIIMALIILFLIFSFLQTKKQAPFDPKADIADHEDIITKTTR